MKLLYKMKIFTKNRKGISGVVAAVLMIALVMVVAVIVWVVVRNIVQDQIGSVESCFGVYDKVTINNRYTCFDTTYGRFQFSISIGDIDINSLIISISDSIHGETKSYTLTNTLKDLDIDPYPAGAGDVKLPEKNGGDTYIIYGTEPDLIQIAPVVNGQQCEVSDSLSEIDDCSLLT